MRATAWDIPHCTCLPTASRMSGLNRLDHVRAFHSVHKMKYPKMYFSERGSLMCVAHAHQMASSIVGCSVSLMHDLSLQWKLTTSGAGRQALGNPDATLQMSIPIPVFDVVLMICRASTLPALCPTFKWQMITFAECLECALQHSQI